jgi:hypothetical protein
MKSVQGDSEKTLNEPKVKLSSQKSRAEKLVDDEIESLPIWVV